MSDHLLHLARIGEEGYAEFQFTCEHAMGAAKWRYRNPDGSYDGNSSTECWLKSWWDAVGSEILDAIEGPITQFPIPIKPSDDWDYDNGGTISFDPTESTQ